MRRSLVDYLTFLKSIVRPIEGSTRWKVKSFYFFTRWKV